MKHTNTKSFRDKVDTYFLETIKESAEDNGNTLTTDHDIMQYAVDRFMSEAGYEIKRQNSIQGAVEYWLSGLALDIDYNYCDIVKRAEAWHECTLTEKQAEMICEKWFNFMACKFLQLAERKGVHIMAVLV
jgi:hypothetical protein